MARVKFWTNGSNTEEFLLSASSYNLIHTWKIGMYMSYKIK